MLSTIRTLEGLEALIQRETAILARYPNHADYPKENVVNRRVLVSAAQKLYAHLARVSEEESLRAGF